MESIEEEPVPIGETGAIPAGPARSGRVMIVEDARPTARLLQHLLMKEGYDVAVASSAEEALRQMDEQRPDALVLDLLLPGMNGLDFLKAIRSNDDFRGCVVIVLSSHWFGKEDPELLAAGANAQFAKPIAPSTLFRKLRELGVSRQVLSAS